MTLVFKKNAKIFAENWQKSQKIVIITSTPVWADFCFLGDGFLWAGYRKLQSKPS
jgi:hypothetical protein